MYCSSLSISYYIAAYYPHTLLLMSLRYIVNRIRNPLYLPAYKKSLLHISIFNNAGVNSLT